MGSRLESRMGYGVIIPEGEVGNLNEGMENLTDYQAFLKSKYGELTETSQLTSEQIRSEQLTLFMFPEKVSIYPRMLYEVYFQADGRKLVVFTPVGNYDNWHRRDDQLDTELMLAQLEMGNQSWMDGPFVTWLPFTPYPYMSEWADKNTGVPCSSEENAALRKVRELLKLEGVLTDEEREPLTRVFSERTLLVPSPVSDFVEWSQVIPSHRVSELKPVIVNQWR